MPLDSQPKGCKFKSSTDRKIFSPSTSFFHTSPASCDGDLEFGVQIHWPWLVNQLRVQVGLWGANSLAMACQSAKGPGGTLGAHTHKLRALVSLWQVPSPAPGVCLHKLIVPT